MVLRSDVTFSIEAVELFERPVAIAPALPLRGVERSMKRRKRSCARGIRLPDGRNASGWAAELMVPKWWFDKSPERSNATISTTCGALSRSPRKRMRRTRAPFGVRARGHALRAVAARGPPPGM
jgi:hypothetical protein